MLATAVKEVSARRFLEWVDQDQALRGFPRRPVVRQQLLSFWILRRAKAEIAVVSRSDEANGSFAERARPIEKDHRAHLSVVTAR